LRVGAIAGVRLLRRILRRLYAAFCAALGCPLKIGIGHLQVVLQGDAGRVAQPCRDDVERGISG